MDSMSAFWMGEMNRGKERMVFDWDQAAQIIRERKPECAIAGLKYDLEWTSGTIYADGEPVSDDYTYLSSTWATPVLILDFTEEIPCFVMEHETKWDQDTTWPASALDILKGKN